MDIVSFSAAISSCVREGEWQQALLLLCEMQRARVSLNTWTANEVMASFAKAVKWQLAIQIFTVEPNLSSQKMWSMLLERAGQNFVGVQGAGFGADAVDPGADITSSSPCRCSPADFESLDAIWQSEQVRTAVEQECKSLHRSTEKPRRHMDGGLGDGPCGGPIGSESPSMTSKGNGKCIGMGNGCGMGGMCGGMGGMGMGGMGGMGNMGNMSNSMGNMGMGKGGMGSMGSMQMGNMGNMGNMPMGNMGMGGVDVCLATCLEATWVEWAWEWACLDIRNQMRELGQVLLKLTNIMLDVAEAMMGMMMGMQAAMQTGSEAAADATPTIKSEDKHVDPRVKAICNDFGISGDTVMRLNDAMREREDYDEDLQALHKLMERATKDGKKPLEVMLAQIRAIRANRFPGKELLDPDIWEFIVKYNLDDRVMNRLIETLNKRRGKSKETLEALNDRLGNAQQPTGLGLLVRLLEGLDETGRLPSPPRRLGGSGTFRPTGTFLHPAASSREAREAREREQERSEALGTRLSV
ncbi:unnamed protein product [Durusdinium trenchii]|uniref:Pentatricopeptide repeat-containing protein n=1 Tax=Durusdinium trenchii TaxID=1381693 RepID=A0ABP0I4F4_9DINO